MNSSAKIVSITSTPAGVERHPETHYARTPVAEVTLLEKRGLKNDLKGKGGVRQINVMRAETLAELATEGFKTAPGEMGEQLVIAGLAPEAFTEGTTLQIGDSAVIRIGIERKGCDRFEAIQGRTKESAAGRLGILAQVVAGGVIRVGDKVLSRE